MIRVARCAAFTLASLSLVVSSTAMAAPSTPAATQVDGWAALTALSGGASAAAACGNAAANVGEIGGASCVLAQNENAAGPGMENAAPQGPPMGVPHVGFPPLPVLLVLAGVLGTMLAIAVANDHNHIPIPNSPA